MYNKKMNKLMIGQALLFGLIIIFFGIIIVREKVPSLKVKNVTRDINNYYEENYSTLNVRVGDLKYNEEDNSYSITYYDRDYNDLNFTIKSINNKITDNYEENYVKGKKVIEKCEDLVLEKYNEVFKNTNYQNIKISFKDLNRYNDAEVIDILEGNIYNTGLYSVSYYVKVDSLDDIYLSNLINSFNSISTSNGLSTNNYSVTFDNNGIIKLVEGGNFNE
ncbi:MAG TPA: hypothetical protein IAB59_02370 [Candidatus Onthousia faecipullorum]|uniref:Uncharacterized protein n=1 Tax=Candidatus Onthousia faecipullorum TaxID=2840887 RepID=A0A9D1G9Z1_9FIRM|nr:hypothetical protein [Candidatus Onthousia faecipullorum]